MTLVSALRNVNLLGKKLQMVGGNTAPAMKLQKLRFTGVTQY